MPRNRRSPGLLRSTARTAGRTAIIAGTATATSNAVHNRMTQKAAPVAPAPPQQASPPMPAAPPTSPDVAMAASTDLVAQLAQLAQLRDAGALTESEFEQAKAKLLN